MPITEVVEFTRLETESLADIEAMLEGTVFHVTRREYWPAIIRAGALLPNSDNSLPTSFGFSSNSFFRNLDCVSVFDYRVPPNDTIKEFRRRCNPFRPALPDKDGIAILVLNSCIHSHLLPWTLWREQEAFSQMVVPHAEAGHPGPISLEFVDRVILLRVTEDPASFAAIVRQSQLPKTAG